MAIVLLLASALCVSSASSTSGAALTKTYACGTEGCAGRRGVANAEDVDPLTSFRVVNPEDGAVEALPIQMRFEVDITERKVFDAYYADKQLCVELNGLWNKCKTLGFGTPLDFRLLPEGNYTTTAYITDSTGQVRYHATTGGTFTVLSQRDYMLRNAQLIQTSREEQNFPEDIDILDWSEQTEIALSEDDNLVLPRTSVLSTNSPMLVIGVKTEVVKGFPRRQAIRDTWGNPSTLPSDVKVLFLGCEPNVTTIHNPLDRRKIVWAVAKERAAYRDLLTDELGCTDSYRGLSDKVKAFMQVAAAEFPDSRFVMLADDDIYVKVDQLARNLREEGREKLYFGEVWAARHSKQVPLRDPQSKYHLPEDQYPMHSFLPYASGPHYVVSMDSVRFVATNHWRLRSMNGLEDVSSGVWLHTMQVPARDTPQFSSMRTSTKCEDSLVSLADLSPLGMRSIHANLNSNRSLCHGFHTVTWHRDHNLLPSLEEMLQRPPSKLQAPAPLQLETFVDTSTNSAQPQVTAIVSTPSNAGTKLQFLSPVESGDKLLRRSCPFIYSDPISIAACQLQHQPALATSDQ
jgi:hypothetical protein